jgi:hypothetical protein
MEPKKDLLPIPPILYLRAPAEVDATPPELANHVRVLQQSDDTVMLQAYFVSPGSVHEAANGWSIPGIRIDGNTAYVERTPAARVALPISVAAELAVLLLKNVAAMGSPDLVKRAGELVRETLPEVPPK